MSPSRAPSPDVPPPEASERAPVSAKERRRRLRGRVARGLFGLLAQIFRLFSWNRAQAVGRLLGRLAWRLAGRDRRRTLDHLALAFPDDDEATRLERARESFRHHGTLLGEILHLATRDCAAVRERVDIDGWEHVEEARREERPILIVTGHCGNWELLAAALNCHGLEMAVVARELDDPGLEDLLLGLRGRFGTRTIERGARGAARLLLSTLRQGKALGMLIDQDTKVEGVWVPFFGRLAYTPVGAAKIALKQGAAVLMTFIERRPDGSHQARIHPPLDLPRDPIAATALMTASIEEQIRRQPSQWVWMHRRWRRRPPEESS